MSKKKGKKLGTLLTVALLMVMGIVVSKPVVANAAEISSEENQDVYNISSPTDFYMSRWVNAANVDKNTDIVEIEYFYYTGKKFKTVKVNKDNFESCTENADGTMLVRVLGCVDTSHNLLKCNCPIAPLSYDNNKSVANKKRGCYKLVDTIWSARLRTGHTNTDGSIVWSKWSNKAYTGYLSGAKFKATRTSKTRTFNIKNVKGVNHYIVGFYKTNTNKFIKIATIKASKKGTTVIKVKKTKKTKPVFKTKTLKGGYKYYDSNNNPLCVRVFGGKSDDMKSSYLDEIELHNEGWYSK